MLRQRVITAMVLVVGVLALLFFGNTTLWRYALALVSGLAAWEWARLSGLTQPLHSWGYALAVALFVWWGLVVDVQAQLPLWLVLVWGGVVPFVLYHFARTEGAWRLGRAPLLMLGLVVLFPFAWALFHLLVRFGPGVTLWLMALVWLADSGAYFSGRAFGRHKLAPRISPGKTWEGVAGGALLALAGAYGGVLLLEQHGVEAALPVALWLGMVAAFSVVGDLFESALKRWRGVKDSSQLLPGHGGVLDRIDSLLFALPLMWLALTWRPLA
ncbi:phosphatidate cytidylyltransferase [Sulfurivirga sp.]|uniref:phosphatidate cytidylyltransferase n=1 Tax=Sulfurivirga sp. TaxID=2614236 RepID=UPI0025CD0C42|nr:phosphatidate cytidylyltransferase [Sulfurivirga sp.]